MPDLESIDIATVADAVFEPHLDTEFTLACEEGEFSAILLDISKFPDHRPEDQRSGRRPFGLVFKCEEAVLPQGTYALSHPALPSCDVFLSPFEGGERWCKLEAIFN